mgnify:CR=1 FL=1
MQLTKKKKAEILKIYDTWMHSYLNGDVATYDSYFADEYHFIGSTDNEEFLNRKDTTQFFKDTADQFSGKTELRKEEVEEAKAPKMKGLSLYGSEVTGLRAKDGKMYSAKPVVMAGKLAYRVTDEFGSFETLPLKKFAAKFG